MLFDALSKTNSIISPYKNVYIYIFVMLHTSWSLSSGKHLTQNITEITIRLKFKDGKLTNSPMCNVFRRLDCDRPASIENQHHCSRSCHSLSKKKIKKSQVTALSWYISCVKYYLTGNAFAKYDLFFFFFFLNCVLNCTP